MSEQTIAQESGGEVASVGELGTSVRGDRLYHNAEIYHEDADSVRNIFADMAGQSGGDISRVVFRGIVSPRALRDIARAPMEADLEVAQPLAGYGEPGWLVYLAQNAPDRQPIVPVPEMVAASNTYTLPSGFNPADLPAETTHQAYIPEDSIGQLYDLWQAFGWELNGVAERASKVRANRQSEPQDRDTWFSGLWNSGRLVCAATAERLTYQGAEGPFNLVESTEWRTHPDYMQHGLMGHNLWRLNNQILGDLRDVEAKMPLVFAECNFMTRADKAGRRAGFEIPSRQFAGQIIAQNVIVNDGHYPSGLRDFVFISLPPQSGDQP
jgi:hypothetical protein